MRQCLFFGAFFAANMIELPAQAAASPFPGDPSTFLSFKLSVQAQASVGCYSRGTRVKFANAGVLMDDDSGRVASVGSAIGGIVCAIGWYVWMAILLLPSHNDNYVWDCNAVNVTKDQYVAPCEVKSGAYWAPGVLMTLGVIMLNMIRWTALGDDMSMGDDNVATKAKVYVGVCFVIMFCSLGGGVWIMVQARAARRGCGVVCGWRPATACVSTRGVATQPLQPPAPRAQQCGALTRRAPRCGRTEHGRRTTHTPRGRCGWARGSPSSCSASACLWEASSSASSGAKRSTPSDCHLKRRIAI